MSTNGQADPFLKKPNYLGNPYIGYGNRELRNKKRRSNEEDNKDNDNNSKRSRKLQN